MQNDKMKKIANPLIQDEFVPAYFGWTELEKQKKRAIELQNLTNCEKNDEKHG